MTTRSDQPKHGYDQPYAYFDSPLMRQLRQEAYGEDIGQHSWVVVEELRSDIGRLALSPSSRVLDVGCGPGGPLGFLLKAGGCSGTGIDISAAALDAARARARSLGIEAQLSVCQADIDEVLPLADRSFSAAVSLDVILHARDRSQIFREIARLLSPGGKFLFTDAGVLTGSISDEEMAARSVHGFTQLCPPGFNERMLDSAGFTLLHTEDRTAGLLANAAGRITARNAHRAELERLEGKDTCDRQLRYLNSVLALSRRGALSRVMYFAENGRP